MDYYVFDCNYVCHKARFTVGSLSHKGQPTGVIYGFLSQVLNVAESFNSSDLLFTWDSKKSFRKQVFPGYKKTRKKNLSEQERKELYEAYEQMEIIYENILPAIGFNNNYKQVGIEGDDIMAELVLNPKNKVHRFNLIASDQDLYQLPFESMQNDSGQGGRQDGCLYGKEIYRRIRDYPETVDRGEKRLMDARVTRFRIAGEIKMIQK